MQEPALTLFEKIWRSHVVADGPGGRALLYIDRHLLHEGSFNAFEQLRASGRTVRRASQTFATPDHFVSTKPLTVPDRNPELTARIDALRANAGEYGVTLFDIGDVRRGIVHVLGPEQGITQPGITLVCGDSHTSTHGALGALSFGIGASEVGHVLATQALWQQQPKQTRIVVRGRLREGIHAKDLMLAIIAKMGANGGAGHVFEYSGEAIQSLSIEGRLTLCNMTIEAGARCGIIAPDDSTYAYLYGKPFAPRGDLWDQAVSHWRMLPSDPAARFDREVTLDASSLDPMVTWGTSPQDAIPITGVVPKPEDAGSKERRLTMQRALDYMGLVPGAMICDTKIDRVFIGSCTNSRIEDLRAAAAILKGRKVCVPAFVSPGSGLVKAQAEAEGLDQVFVNAGVEWRESGCSMCVGMNGDLAEAGERVASTSNRNFEGRQGKAVRTHLMSPAMAAAAAVAGRLVDVRTMQP